MKKTLSLILAVLMLVAVFPATSMSVIANAITITSTDLIYGDADGLTRAEWLHNLAVVGDLNMDENAHMDNYFNDLTSSHKYYNDILLNLQYGLIDIQAGSELRPDEPLTRDFAVSTLNALLSFQVDESESYTFSDSTELWSYTEEVTTVTEGEGETTEGTDTGDESTDEDVYADFIEQDAAAKLVTEQRLKDSAQIAINRGWVELIDGAFLPGTVVTKTEIEKMLEDAIDVLEITVIDENYENVFEFTEDVIVVPDGTVVSEDIENNTVSITDCPVELAVGNKFAVYYNGIPDVYLAEEITVVENVTTITVSEVADEEAFTNVDAQGIVYDPSQIEVIPAEGAEVTVTEVVEEATVITEPENADAFISYPEMKLSPGRINLCKISVTKELKVNSECKISVKLELNNPYVSYYANKDYFESYLFCNDVKIEISGSANAMPDDVPLCVVAVGGIGTFEINLTYELGGKAKYITKGGMMIGVRGAPFESCRNLTKYVQHYQYVEAEACGSAGLNFSFNIKAPCVHAKLYAEVGVKGSVALKKYLDQTLPKMCCHMYACLYAKAGFYLKLGFSEWNTKYQAEKDIYNYKNSPYKVVQHYEDGVIVSECTKGQNPNVDMVNYDYFTRTNSRWFGSGWSGWNGTSGINAANEIVPVFSYTLNELNEATITAYNIDPYYLEIPSTVDDYTVVAIGKNAFENKQVETLIIPDSVKVINAYAFNNCKSLSKVTLSQNLEVLYGMAFGNCDSLKEITIPKSLTFVTDPERLSCGLLNNYIYYANGPFNGCDNLKKVVFEEGITKVTRMLFGGCTGLESIKIPDTVTTIEEAAFFGCSNLFQVVLSSNLQNLYGMAFWNCDSLKEISIPKSLTFVTDPEGLACELNSNYRYYSQGPFSNCDNLKKVVFEEGTTKVTRMLFGGCTGLENIQFSDSLTIIEEAAFFGCSNLQEVLIPNTVRIIDMYAFYDCTKLSKAILSNGLQELYGMAFGNCGSLNELFVPKSLVVVDDPQHVSSSLNDGYFNKGPFYNCENLKKIVFEEGRKEITRMLFGGCTGLETIQIPDTVETIAEGAFYGCTNLTEVKISDSVNTISLQSFVNCSSLKTIIIPDMVDYLETGIFKNCTSLETVKLPNSTVTIPERTFYNCSSLKTIELPKTVESIEESAFYGCSALESLNLGDTSLKLVERYAFQNCSSLKVSVLPESVESIGNQAFMGCAALEKVYIPESTKTFGNSVFSGCEALSDVTIKDYGVTEIGADTFKDCASLKRIELPKGLTKIGSSAFMNGTSLDEVIIPESVTSIDSTAFSYPEKTTIYGKTGSLAESFATENGFKFVPNGIMTEGILIKDGNEQVVLEQGESYRASFEIYPEDSNEVITLTADNDYVTINGHDIYADKWSAGDSVITASTASGLTYNFNIHVRSVKNIEIVTNPQKTTYAIGEEFDKTGMVVRVNYNDETTKDIMNFTVEGFDSSAEGTNTITVKWTSARGYEYTDTLELNIVDLRPKLTEIVVEALPTKLNYELREKVDYTGLVIMGVYTDGSIQEITDYTLSGYNALKTGVQTVTVTKGDFKTEFTVAVGVTRTVASYEVIEDNGSFKRAVGDSFTVDDIKLKIVYDDGTYNIIGSGFSITTVDTSTQGTKNVQLFYNDETINFTVFVEGYFDIFDFGTRVLGDSIVTDSSNFDDLTCIIDIKEGYKTEVQESYVYGETKRLGTGSTVKVYDEKGVLLKEYKIVVQGDVNGDSICDALDLMLVELARHESNNVSLDGVYLLAGDFTEDGKIEINDFNAVVNKAIA